MKLAEALLLRADLQKRIEQIKNSIRPSNNEVLKLSVAIKNSIEENRKRSKLC